MLSKSLSGSLLRQNIPALTLEVGGASSLSSIAKAQDVEAGIKAIWDILSSFNMVKTVKQNFNYRQPNILKNKILKYSLEPRASKKGIAVYLANPGQLVKKGQPVATIYDVFGNVQETLRASKDGLFLGHSDFSVAYPGAELVSFGIL